jgi:hypothetical protein
MKIYPLETGLDNDFEIPASFTAGKQQVKVRLEVAPGNSWSADEYRLYSCGVSKLSTRWMFTVNSSSELIAGVTRRSG